MAMVPDVNLIAQVQTIEKNLIDLYRTLQSITPSATINMASAAQAYNAIDQMLGSMVTNGTT